MGWWEQLITLEPPEDRWDDPLWGVWDRSTTQVKEGTYSAKLIHPGSATRLFFSYAIGWDWSAYPTSVRYCFWLYISDVTALGASDVFYVGYRRRGYGAPSIYKTFDKTGLVTGWNFISIPLSDMDDSPGEPDNTRSRENVLELQIYIERVSTGNVTFYIDDFYLSTDGTKVLDTDPTYQIKHFKRYNTTTLTNQEYAGILEPSSFKFSRSLNAVTEASFTLPIDAYSDLPSFMDSVRIYRNGMCAWDGVVLRKEKDYLSGNCVLYCLTSNFILQRILDLTHSIFIVSSSVDSAVSMKNYVYYADGVGGAGFFKQQGFGIYDWAPCGLSSEMVAADSVIPWDEFVHPWDYISSTQNHLGFDFEIRPPFVFNYWEPQKGRTVPIKLFQDTHFKVRKVIESAHDLYSACRSSSRGSGASFLGDGSDTTAKNTYAQLVNLLNTQGKSLTEVQAASAVWVAEHKTPATIFDIELLPGGWVYPWDLGDTITAVVEGTEYTKRIYSIDVDVTQEGEKVGLKLG